MAFYSVIIEGADFPARVFESADGPLGFFTTRFVEAADEKAAELAAVELIKQELEPLLGGRCDEEANASMSLDQIREVKELPETAPGFGFTWFAMGS